MCYLPPCHYGGKCRGIQNEQHCREYGHPPLCPSVDNHTSCKETNDEQHMLRFRHRQKCDHGSACTRIDSDPSHCNKFKHPEFCRDGGKCDNMDAQHLKSYRHLPLCRHDRECIDYQSGRSNEHCQAFRHCIPMCSSGHFCVRFHDEKHKNEESHPFNPPCTFTPFHCSQYDQLSTAKSIRNLSIGIQQHCATYSHVCRWGRHCRETSEVHWTTTIHLARHVCRYGDQCRKLGDQDHLNSFSHQGIADIRRLCSHSGNECRDRHRPEHIQQYRHQGNHDRSGVIASFGQNKDIDFLDNQECIIQAIQGYAIKLDPKRPLVVPKEIQKWILGLQPVHRCSKAIFESILVHGHVMSREHMEHLKKPKFVAQAAQEHKRVRAILDRHTNPAIEDSARKYIESIVSMVYGKKYDAGATADAGTTTSSAPPSELDSTILKQEKQLNVLLNPGEVNTVRQYATNIAEASWNLHHAPTGVKYKQDKLLGTDKHVFSILGPHLGHSYGDIFLVFRSEVMLHPDANFSPHAATSFSSGRAFKNRVWTEDPQTPDGRVECFHRSTLHCSIPGYEYAAAAELMAITGSQNKSMNVDLKDIVDRWLKVDSHSVIEAHLPRLIPLDYVEEVYIPKNLFASLTPAAQESATHIFGDSLHITDHDINLADAAGGGGGGSHPTDKIRSDYHDHVNKLLKDKVGEQMKRPRQFRGTVITLEPSQFTDHIVLPVNIKKAYEQHRRLNKSAADSGDVYIYWQAMYGDMMVTLSNEQIDPEADQPHIRCLVCYIADTPSTTTTASYHVSRSYLTVGEPQRHCAIKPSDTFLVASCSFHRGCDVDDFLTYRLKLEKRTGRVTLSHAGPNSLYCYETISCELSKTDLDLNQLYYIHVSAGARKVPIRNLFVSFEPVSDLHPMIDATFGRGQDMRAAGKKSHDRDAPHSSQSTHSTLEPSPSMLQRFAHAIGHLLGLNPAGEKLEPCRDSIDCLLRASAKHIQEFSHPCPYSELCRNKDKEPHLTHQPHRAEPCPYKDSCNKLTDPRHRAAFRHAGLPDFLIPCSEKSDCHDRTREHQMKYSHDEEPQGAVKRSREWTHFSSSHIISVTFPTDLGDSTQTSASSQYPNQASTRGQHGDDRTACRHGSDCHDQHVTSHCSKFSHPVEQDTRASSSSSLGKTPCHHGSQCRDQKDAGHCFRFSHPNDRPQRSTEGSRANKIPCKHGHRCHDMDPGHRAKYSHPSD